MKSVLSIQSHVAFGYVGNRAAVFPLQRLGIDTHAVHTVQFSNHTGYGDWTGEVFAPEHIAQVIEGIHQRGHLLDCDALLSGYMGDATLGQIVVDTVARIRTARDDLLYCCDPVMGDVGRGFFVRPGIPEFMRQVAVPAADIITPNLFELEYLTHTQISDLRDALNATAMARTLGPRVVLVTSLTRNEAEPNTIEMLVDTHDGAWLVATPQLPLEPPPNGAGDCVAALFLATYLANNDAKAALEHAASAIYGVFAATQEAGTRELALIQAQDELRTPQERFIAAQVR